MVLGVYIYSDETGEIVRGDEMNILTFEQDRMDKYCQVYQLDCTCHIYN